MSDQDDAQRVYLSITEYCDTYKIPRENLLEILEDQKVLPMIRGKATEYIGAAVLKKELDPRDWSVEKLNLNPQPGSGSYDEDVSITYKRTGKRLKAEMKSAVRGSFRMGTSRTKVKVPHLKVKCHRSRSNLSKATNDRYRVGDFDVMALNLSNAIFATGVIDRGLPLIENADAIAWLKGFYDAQTDEELRRMAYDDWRFCLPCSIAQEDGTIPRTPVVQMEKDPIWFGIDSLAVKLRTLIHGVRA